MHQLFHDGALAFIYFGAAIMAALFLYVIFWLPFVGTPTDD